MTLVQSETYYTNQIKISYTLILLFKERFGTLSKCSYKRNDNILLYLLLKWWIKNEIYSRSHCIELMAQREELLKRKVERETMARKRIEEKYSSLVSFFLIEWYWLSFCIINIGCDLSWSPVSELTKLKSMLIYLQNASIIFTKIKRFCHNRKGFFIT